MKMKIWAGLALAATTTAWAADVEEVAPGVSFVRGQFTRGIQPDGNSVILHGTAGTVIIDTGRHQQQTQKILTAATQGGKKPVAIINTHWHLDHIGGNALVREKFPKVTVISSGALANARKGFLAEYRKALADAIAKAPAERSAGFKAEAALIDSADKLGPTDVLTAQAERTVAGRNLVLGVEKNAATEADVWVLDRASGTLITGDLVTLPVPFLDTADAEGWSKALDRLVKVDAKLVVPGHGEPMKPKDLGTYRKAFQDLLACAKSKRTADECSDEWFKTIGDLARGTDPALAKSSMKYYVGNALRKPEAGGTR
jgi:glyoxylase-like metal-dependent hydrolase (beta-lactamase superfamily II)